MAICLILTHYQGYIKNNLLSLILPTATLDKLKLKSYQVVATGHKKAVLDDD